MSTAAYEHAWQHSQVTGAERHALLLFAHYACDEDWRTTLSIQAFAERMGISERRASYHINALMEQGELVLVGHGGGRGNANTYQVAGACARNGSVCLFKAAGFTKNSRVSMSQSGRVSASNSRVSPVENSGVSLPKLGSESHFPDQENPGPSRTRAHRPVSKSSSTYTVAQSVSSPAPLAALPEREQVRVQPSSKYNRKDELNVLWLKYMNKDLTQGQYAILSQWAESYVLSGRGLQSLEKQIEKCSTVAAGSWRYLEACVKGDLSGIPRPQAGKPNAKQSTPEDIQEQNRWAARRNAEMAAMWSKGSASR